MELKVISKDYLLVYKILTNAASKEKETDKL
jgi:hypothetical protein